MNPRKTPAGTWEYRFSHNGRQYSVTRKLKQEAINAAREREKALQQGHRPDDRTLAEHVKRWADSRHDVGLQAMRIMQRVARMLEAHPAGATRLTDVTPELLRGLVADMAQGRRPATVAAYASPLQGALKAAVDEQLLLRNPWRNVHLPRIDEHARAEERVILTPEQAIVLEDAAASLYTDTTALMVRTLLRTGLRWGEAAALQPRHLDASGRTLHVTQSVKVDGIGTTKTGRPRIIPLGPKLTRELATLDGRFMFARPHGGHWSHSDWWTYRWTPLKAASGLSLRPHDLRHTAASWMLNRAHLDIVTVQHILGHTDVKTTMRYLHTSPDILAQAGGRIEAIHDERDEAA